MCAFKIYYISINKIMNQIVNYSSSNSNKDYPEWQSLRKGTTLSEKKGYKPAF